MTNRIREVTVVNHRFDPIATELRLFVEVDSITPTTQIKGRLMGPRCVDVTTVEIAYPWRELERADCLTSTMVVPEPSWWEPKKPFLYEGPIELWEAGQLRERMQISHAIRWLQWTPRGLRLNGKPFVLRGRVVKSDCTEAELRHLRDAGFNAVFATFASTADLRRLGDRAGMFISNGWNEKPDTLSWNIPFLDVLQNSRLENRNALPAGIEPSSPLLGPNTAVLVCREESLPSVSEGSLPKLVVTKSLPTSPPLRDDVIGWIELPS